MDSSMPKLKPCYKRNRARIVVLDGTLRDTEGGVRAHGISVWYFRWWRGVKLLEEWGVVFGDN